MTSLLLGVLSASAVALFWANLHGGVARLGVLIACGVAVFLVPLNIFIWQASKRLAEPCRSLPWPALSDEQFRDAGRLARVTFAVQLVGMFCVAFALGWLQMAVAVVAMRFLQA